MSDPASKTTAAQALLAACSVPDRVPYWSDLMSQAGLSDTDMIAAVRYLKDRGMVNVVIRPERGAVPSTKLVYPTLRGAEANAAR